MFGNRSLVQAEPGPIIGPLSSFFGAILDFLYNFAYTITPTEAHTLGISIIFLTIVSRILLFPLTYKSQKSMQAMQKLQPEMEKIKKKYENQKSQDAQKKMGQEINKLYSENGASPIMGCLPMLIQFPILMSLFFIMNQPYRFIGRLNMIYSELAQRVIDLFEMDVTGTLATNYEIFFVVRDIAIDKIPATMDLTLGYAPDLMRVLARFTSADWQVFRDSVSPEAFEYIQPVLESKMATEYFLGITLVENVGFNFPAILIPIACVVFTFLSSYMSQKLQAKPKDPSAKMQQTMMLVVMPAMMGVITFGMPAGLGLYWATGSVIQIAQQHFIGKWFKKPAVDVV